MLQDLHTLLVETQVTEGKLVCGNCGHEYNIHQGIANFLLPNHLGMVITFCMPPFVGGGGVGERDRDG
jgi:multifunctional methyltransferase subunit TRM112